MKSATGITDLEDRDPNSLGQHLQVGWDEVIGEPETIRSPECAWTVSQHCFQISKSCCYTFLSVLCAPIAACCLGCTFACIAFEHIWCLIPCLRIWKISCAATKSFVTACSQAIIEPIVIALGSFWSYMKIRISRLSEEIKEKEDILLA